MDSLFLILYAGATFLALRSLISLMAYHRIQYRQQFAIENQVKLKEQAARKKAEAEKTEESADAAA
jgi:hypothetical protein